MSNIVRKMDNLELGKKLQELSNTTQQLGRDRPEYKKIFKDFDDLFMILKGIHERKTQYYGNYLSRYNDQSQVESIDELAAEISRKYARLKTLSKNCVDDKTVSFDDKDGLLEVYADIIIYCCMAINYIKDIYYESGTS